MAYELSLGATRLGPARQMRNPFTGVAESCEPLEMSDEELRAASAVLVRNGGKLDERGVGLVSLERAALAFTAFGARGDLVKVTGDLACACACLFELATAGQLVIHSMNDEEGIVTTPEALARARDLEDDVGPVVLVEKVEELVSRLAPDQAAALAYSNSVT